MIPDLEMVARAMLRALEETIIPALPANNSFALENASLVIEGLQQILQRGSQCYEIALEEIQLESERLNSIRSILPLTAEISSDVSQELEIISALTIPALPRLIELRQLLRKECERLFRLGLSDQSGEVRQKVAHWGLEFAEAEGKIAQMFKAET